MQRPWSGDGRDRRAHHRVANCDLQCVGILCRPMMVSASLLFLMSTRPHCETFYLFFIVCFFVFLVLHEWLPRPFLLPWLPSRIVLFGQVVVQESVYIGRSIWMLHDSLPR